MKKIIRIYNIYQFDELSNEAKEVAIEDYIEFEIEVYEDDSDSLIYDSVQKAEDYHTPWFLNSIIYEDHKEDIIEILKNSKYWFFDNGKLVSIELIESGEIK